MSSFYWGYFVSHIPGGLLAQQFGGKYVLSVGVLLSGFLSTITPLSVTYGKCFWFYKKLNNIITYICNLGGAYALIVIQALLGLCQGGIFPALMDMLTSWIPTKERATICSLIIIGAAVRKYHDFFINTRWGCIQYPYKNST